MTGKNIHTYDLRFHDSDLRMLWWIYSPLEKFAQVEKLAQSGYIKHPFHIKGFLNLKLINFHFLLSKLFQMNSINKFYYSI